MEQMLALQAAGLPDAELRRVPRRGELGSHGGTWARGAPIDGGLRLTVLRYAGEYRRGSGATYDGSGGLADALAVSGQVVAETDDDAVGFYRALDSTSALRRRTCAGRAPPLPLCAAVLILNDMPGLALLRPEDVPPANDRSALQSSGGERSPGGMSSTDVV